MMRTTQSLPETTVDSQAADPLDDALADLRISGSVLLHEAYASPWAIAIPSEERLRQILEVGPQTRILLFHFVRSGSFTLQLAGQEAVTVESGDVAICPSGAEHRMSCGRKVPAVAIEALLRGGLKQNLKHAAASDAVGTTELVCGVFYATTAPLNPLLAALPPVMKVATGDASFSPMLSGVAWMLAHEVDRKALGGFAAARVIELFCAESIRAFQRSAGTDHPGWFKGLADPRIAKAIRCIHGAPGEPWSVERLAAEAALSPSRFAARFKEAMGRSVMNYVATWRANVACRLLRETSLGLAEIAGRVGYASLPAFSRAFKAIVGQAPAAWRATRVAPVPHARGTRSTPRQPSA